MISLVLYLPRPIFLKLATPSSLPNFNGVLDRIGHFFVLEIGTRFGFTGLKKLNSSHLKIQRVGRRPKKIEKVTSSRSFPDSNAMVIPERNDESLNSIKNVVFKVQNDSNKLITCIVIFIFRIN